MRADVQELDLRRDTQGRGCNTTGSPPVTDRRITYIRQLRMESNRVHPGRPGARFRKEQGNPQGAFITFRESAEGIVDG